MPQDVSSEWLSIEQLAIGSEQIGGMLVRSAQIRAILHGVQKFGARKPPVLIAGEPGTGKEMLARALHFTSSQSRGPFVAFNCAHISEPTVALRLFGREQDEVDGASDDSTGCLRAADGGVLFLDEITRLPLGLQTRLLRVVETDEFSPIDSDRVYHADVRVVAATTEQLHEVVSAGRFSDALFRRLSAIALRIPPLRNRHNAIGAFCAHFIAQYNGLLERDIRYLSRRALRALTTYDWPGNVREFSQAIRDAVVQTSGDRIDLDQLPEYVSQRLCADAAAWHPSGGRRADVRRDVSSAPPPAPVPVPEEPSPESISAVTTAGPTLKGCKPEALTLNEVIKNTLVRSLREAEGNRRRTASLLGVSRSTLYRMLVRYGIDPGGCVERKRSTAASARPS